MGPIPLVVVAAGLLVLLPAGGLMTLWGQKARPIGAAVGLSVWSLAVLVGFPMYFPGERADALATGLAVLGTAVGGAPDPMWADRLDDLLPAVADAHPVPAPARLAVPSEPKVAPPTDADAIILPYEGDGRTLTVPVTVAGKTEAEVWMLFDTGASLTTLDTATLNRIGVSIPPDAPEVTLRTAAGPRTARLVLLERMWVGGLEVEAVTVSVCDACADSEVTGLLGLNVTGRFLVTVDTEGHQLVLTPRSDVVDRSVDVSPWLDIGATATRWPDGRVEVTVEAKNRAARPIETAVVAIVCEKTWYAELHDIAVHSTATTTVSVPRGSACGSYTVGLERAQW